LIPSSHEQWFGLAGKFNGKEDHPLRKSFRKNPVARDSAAAEEWGMSHGELHRLYDYLEERAHENGFESFASISSPSALIENDQRAPAPDDNLVFRNGPLSLWEMYKAASKFPARFRFRARDEWLLILQVVDETVEGYVIDPACMRFGAFEPDPEHCQISTALTFNIDAPILDVPESIVAELELFASTNFPGLGFDYVPPPQLVRRNILPAKLARAYYLSARGAQL
jgi:hypothetical protein